MAVDGGLQDGPDLGRPVTHIRPVRRAAHGLEPRLEMSQSVRAWPHLKSAGERVFPHQRHGIRQLWVFTAQGGQGLVARDEAGGLDIGKSQELLLKDLAPALGKFGLEKASHPEVLA